MSGVSTVQLVFRIGVTAVAVVGPTVLFLGLYRFLEWLRDDELVEVLVERGVLDSQAPRPAPLDALATATESRPGVSHCENCGTPNLSDDERCWECGSAL